MPYLAEEDLTSLIYQEKIDLIKRDNPNAVPKAINGAIKFAKSFLGRFDLLKLFGDADTEPEVEDENLKSMVIDIACYKLARVGNPGLNMEELRAYYEDAEAWLKATQKGGADPEGWPLKADNEENGTQPGHLVTWNSNPKRDDRY